MTKTNIKPSRDNNYILRMTTDEKIAIAVALMVIGAFFLTFLPAFWTTPAIEPTPSPDVFPVHDVDDRR